MKNGIPFNLDRISVADKVTGIYLKEAILRAGQVDFDIIDDLFTLRLDAFILSRLNETQVTDYQLPKPSFLDWLLGRRRIIKISISAKEVLKNPPKLNPDESVFLYEIQKPIK